MPSLWLIDLRVDSADRDFFDFRRRGENTDALMVAPWGHNGAPCGLSCRGRAGRVSLTAPYGQSARLIGCPRQDLRIAALSKGIPVPANHFMIALPLETYIATQRLGFSSGNKSETDCVVEGITFEGSDFYGMD